MLIQIQKNKKEANHEEGLALSILHKPSFYQDLFTVNIKHIKEFTYKAKAHHQKNPLL